MISIIFYLLDLITIILGLTCIIKSQDVEPKDDSLLAMGIFLSIVGFGAGMPFVV